VGMARILRLPVREAKGGDCGTYSVPGSKVASIPRSAGFMWIRAL
jgi:hypothetical protein